MGRSRTASTTPGALRSPSSLQQQVLDFVKAGSGHGVVEATAGSGKTTTLVQVARLLPPDQAACFLAFNRATAAELRARLPSHVEATTIHALGRAALVKAIPSLAAASPDGNKYRSLALELVLEHMPHHPQPSELAEYLARLADLGRLALITSGHATPPKAAMAANATPADVDDVADLATRHKLQSPVTTAETPALQALLPNLLGLGLAGVRAGQLDYTDMLYATLEFGLPPPRYGFVCVDEAQDLSPLTLALVMSLVRAGARALFVGDPKQAIYGFAGADNRSTERIIDTTNATVLPLSVSFRCPSRHVALARRYSPTMQAVAGAKAGRVTLTQLNRLPSLVRADDLVMSRVNAPLARLALELAQGGTPVRVLGTDLASPALSLARHLFRQGIPPHAQQLVAEHDAAEERRLEVALLTSPALAEVLEISRQRHRALSLLLAHLKSSGIESIGALEGLAHTLLGGPIANSADEQPTPVRAAVLSTVHKAKGREADRTFLLYPEELAPHAPQQFRRVGNVRSAGPLQNEPHNAHDGQADSLLTDPITYRSVETADNEAEANVLFVALTRAKSELVLVERHKGALAERLAQFRRTRRSFGLESDDLAHKWSQVLSLAFVMSRQVGNPLRLGPAPDTRTGRKRSRPSTRPR